MKKIFTLLSFLALAAIANAQAKGGSTPVKAAPPASKTVNLSPPKTLPSVVNAGISSQWKNGPLNPNRKRNKWPTTSG
jgi:hypothetical protein